jgi:uncharacterized repeat protein (TIGR04076 family)
VAALGFRTKLKITVVKKLSAEDIYGKNLPVTPKYPHLCDRLTEGQEFIVRDTGAMPEGFCPWAWDDLARVVLHLQFGGEFAFNEESNMIAACCTDAIRPVMFKVEKLEH